MSFTGRITSSVVCGAMSAASQTDRTGGAANNISEPIPVAVAGVLSTRTDNDSGIVTSAGHSFTEGTGTLFIFWAGGCAWRYDETAHDANTFTIDVGVNGGSTGVLPVEGSSVTVCLGTSLVASIDGDNMKMLAALCDQRCILYCRDVSSVLVATPIVLGANDAFVWRSPTDDNGNVTTSYTNPLTGNPVTSILAAQASSTAIAALQVSHVYDPTP